MPIRTGLGRRDSLLGGVEVVNVPSSRSSIPARLLGKEEIRAQLSIGYGAHSDRSHVPPQRCPSTERRQMHSNITSLNGFLVPSAEQQRMPPMMRLSPMRRKNQESSDDLTAQPTVRHCSPGRRHYYREAYSRSPSLDRIGLPLRDEPPKPREPPPPMKLKQYVRHRRSASPSAFPENYLLNLGTEHPTTPRPIRSRAAQPPAIPMTRREGMRHIAPPPSNKPPQAHGIAVKRCATPPSRNYDILSLMPFGGESEIVASPGGKRPPTVRQAVTPQRNLHNRSSLDNILAWV